MRRRVFRLSQRLRVFVLAGPRAAGLLLLREADKSAQRRRILLDQIALYEAWWHAHQRLHVFGEPAYAAALGRFLAPYRELAQYRAWWIATRRTVMTANAIEHIVTDWARPANLRSSDWLERYLTAMPAPMVTRQESEHRRDEPWPY